MPTTDDDRFDPDALSVYERAIGRRREDFMQALAYVDIRMKSLEKECEKAHAELSDLRKWAEDDRRRSTWYYDNREHLEAVVEGSKWASMTRKVVSVIAGSIIGVIMFMQTVLPWLVKKVDP